MCDIDGLEIIRPGRTCPDSLHDFVPIIEGNRTVGIICIICGHRVREDVESKDNYPGGHCITEEGKLISISS
jgi:hypothetical protein